MLEAAWARTVRPHGQQGWARTVCPHGQQGLAWQPGAGSDTSSLHGSVPDPTQGTHPIASTERCPMPMAGAVPYCLLDAFAPGWGSGTTLIYHPPREPPMLLDPGDSSAITAPSQGQPSAALCVSWPCISAAKP